MVSCDFIAMIRKTILNAHFYQNHTLEVNYMDSVQLRAGIIGLGVGKAHAEGYINSPDADLVAVCDMNADRLQLYAEECIAALEAGVNVVCEKPMAVNTKAAKAMVAAAKSSGKRLMMSYNYRF